MRHSYLLLLLIISCSKDQVVPGRGSATFSMSHISRGLNGGRVASSTTPAFVLLSIEDNTGKSVAQNKKLTLFAFGQGYESESIELPEGNYKLTQFQILNANDTIIYATPLSGSKLAQYVTKPLPIDFTITKNASTLVVPQVLAVTSTDTPSNFGYVNFEFEIVKLRGKRIKEIWQDEPYAQYRVYYFYKNILDTLPSRELTYYYFNNVWNLLDSSTISYNSSGKVSQMDRAEIFGLGTPAVSSVSYTYDVNGLLSKTSMSGNANGGNNWVMDFFYDQNGKPLFSHQSLPGSVNFHYLYEYSVNKMGDIDTVFRYSVTPSLGKTLQFKFTYQYDQFNSILPFPFRDAPFGGKHNVIYQREVGYNLVGNPPALTIEVDCWTSNLFQYNLDGKPKSSIVSNPNGCNGIALDDQTKFTYIYE